MVKIIFVREGHFYDVKGTISDKSLLNLMFF